MPALVIAQGAKAGARYAVDGELVVGRSPSCDVPLVDNKVSRRHARIRMRGNQATLADLGSRNGTWLNGERIQREVPLASGDRLQIGDTSFLFDPPMRVSIDDDSEVKVEARPVAELLPVAGAAGAVLQAAASVLAAPSEAAVLRVAAEAACRAVAADLGAALLPGEEGLLAAAVHGAQGARVPRELLSAALERRAVGNTGVLAAAPLWAGGNAFGLLFVSRASEHFGQEDLAVLAALGRLCGEALTAARGRSLPAGEDSLVGAHRAWRRVLEQARRAGASPAPVVVSGEPGVGKSLLASYIHARSPRALGPLVRVDCRAPVPVVEDEIFGRPAGPGLPPLTSALLRADGGTLVLVGVDAMARPAAERLAKLLARHVAPTPEGGEAACDVRLVATAREKAQESYKRGELDIELAQALKGVDIMAPPLRERASDVPLLFEFFAARAARKLRRTPPALTPEAARLMGEYAWPGNVRELENCAERLALLGLTEAVSGMHLPREVQEGPVGGSGALGDLVARVERDAVAAALRRANGKKIRAAAILGISRPTLDKKIAAYGLTVK